MTGLSKGPTEHEWTPAGPGRGAVGPGEGCLSKRPGGEVRVRSRLEGCRLVVVLLVAELRILGFSHPWSLIRTCLLSGNHGAGREGTL